MPGQLQSGSVSWPKIETFPADNCPLCAIGSTKLTLTGDQFLPNAAPPRTVELKLADRPGWLVPFLGRARGTKAVRAHHSQGKRSHILEIFIAVDCLCAEEGSAFSQRLAQTIQQAMPASADRIYYCDDTGAKAIVDRILGDLKRRQRFVPEVVSLRELSSDPSRFRRESDTCLVVAGCAWSGRSLVTLSMLLREIEPSSALVYLIGLRRMGSEAEQRQLHRTLTHASQRLSFPLHSVEDIFLTDNTVERESSWRQERMLLEQLIDGSHISQDFPLTHVEQRLERLREAEGETQRGLIDDLFWPSAAGDPLELRPNFSLFPLPEGERLTQAEIHLIVAAILSHLRQQKPGCGLAASPHQRALLAPNNFSLFSDGVLRAALLRAALPRELDYEIDRHVEAEVVSLLQDVFAHAHDATGEAATEFLLALALHRMRLSAAGLAEVLKVATNNITDPTGIQFHLVQRLRGESGLPI